MPSTEERLDQIEQSLREIRWRVGLGPPPGDQVNGTPVGKASMVMQPDQLPQRNQAQEDLLTKIQLAQQTGTLTLDEALAKYKDEPTLNAFFHSSITLIDHSDFVRVQFKKGWQRVPVRFRPQLQGVAEVPPEEKRGKEGTAA